MATFFHYSRIIIFLIFLELCCWAFRLVKERSGAGDVVYRKSYHIQQDLLSYRGARRDILDVLAVSRHVTRDFGAN
jgi:hypothetical protein